MKPKPMPSPTDDLVQLRAQIAVVAARLVAQDGADYAVAKRKAATHVLGDAPAASGVLPDNAQIEEEVLRYQELFQASTQPARLLHLRTIALQVMDALAQFNPYVTGPVLTGSAGEHDDIALQLFDDSAKEVQIFLLDKKVAFDLTETPHFKGPRFDPVETVSFVWHKEGVHAELYELNDLRGALKRRADGRVQRADASALRALMAIDNNNSPQETA